MDFGEIFDHEGKIGSRDPFGFDIDDIFFLHMRFDNVEDSPDNDHRDSKPSLYDDHSIFLLGVIKDFGPCSDVAEPAAGGLVAQDFSRLLVHVKGDGIGGEGVDGVYEEYHGEDESVVEEIPEEQHHSHAQIQLTEMRGERELQVLE